MRSILALLIIIAVATPLHAQDDWHNAWGFVFAPMNYHIVKGYQVDTQQSYASLDLGLTYTRFFTRSWSGRFELVSVDRAFNTFAPATGAMDDIGYFVVDENAVQSNLVVNLDERFDMGGKEGRVSLGGGLVLSGIYDQTVTPWYPADVPGSGAPQEGTYAKWGWLLEGGMNVTFYRRSAIFARFRVQQDEDTFGESDDADIVRRLAAYGFHVGMEYGF